MSRDAVRTEGSATPVSGSYRFTLPPSKLLKFSISDGRNDSAPVGPGTDTEKPTDTASGIRYLTYVSVLVQTVALLAASAVLLA